jgi:hypothetical protein
LTLARELVISSAMNEPPPVPPQNLIPSAPATPSESEPRSAPAPAPSTPSPAGPGPEPTPWSLVLIAVLALCLLFGLWGLWTVIRAASAASDDPGLRIVQLQQEVTTLTRSDQISREANLKLQSSLAERDEEIAALRADLAFYERFVGSTAQRRGLSVHELRLTPAGEGVWHYAATLTQNLNRDAASEGELRLVIEGSRDGRLQTLDWAALRQQDEAPALAYSFKYFQQVEGDIVLPEGFAPTRVTVRLAPKGGAAVEQSFSWADAVAQPRSSTDVAPDA